VGKIVSLRSETSTGMKSFNQVITGSGSPVALQDSVVLRSFSIALSDGLSTMRGYPGGAVCKHKREKQELVLLGY